MLGVSASEFVRQAADLLDPDDVAGLRDLESLLPELDAAIGRMQGNLSAAIAHSEEQARELARLASPAYREAVRREVAADPAAVAAAAALFGLDAEERAHGVARVGEAREPWAGEFSADQEAGGE